MVQGNERERGVKISCKHLKMLARNLIDLLIRFGHYEQEQKENKKYVYQIKFCLTLKITF